MIERERRERQELVETGRRAHGWWGKLNGPHWQMGPIVVSLSMSFKSLVLCYTRYTSSVSN